MAGPADFGVRATRPSVTSGGSVAYYQHMKHLLRHPLAAGLLALVVLFVAFFMILPALSLIIHLVIAVAIIWVIFSLFQVYRRHQPSR